MTTASTFHKLKIVCVCILIAIERQTQIQKQTKKDSVGPRERAKNIVIKMFSKVKAKPWRLGNAKNEVLQSDYAEYNLFMHTKCEWRLSLVIRQDSLIASEINKQNCRESNQILTVPTL